ncbi:MAG: alpha/beta hydrolase [Betaproteobacteria bacterium]|nr:MAG: alpha/beta hydrolase [Betaproteobacteria bacterium]
MSAWRADRLLTGFEAKEFAFEPDYDGAVVATLVRLPAPQAARGAVLYVHGFVDYFFQRHMAERFAAEGYAFHALDLRKHGRSLRPHQHPCFCKDVAEYGADLTRALEEIGEPVLLAGHSTGGLICALYAKDGARREQVRALWLNSPFFEFNAQGLRRAQLGLALALGRRAPFLNNPKAVLPAYVESLHRDWRGEWQFDLQLKPHRGFPAYFGWLAAISAAHAKVHAGLDLERPVLAMHSDEADIILDWRHIARWSRTLGREVTVLQFPGALHDVVLSRREIREEVFRQLFAWAARVAA